MAPTRPISSTAQALFRVFVQPTIATGPSTTPRAASALIRPSISSSSSAGPTTLQFLPSLAPHSQRRTAVKYRPPVQSKVVCDESIGSMYINLVTEDGTFQPGQRLADALRAIDRATHRVVQVDPARADAEHPFPVCKVLSKSAMREAAREAERRRRSARSADDLTKTLELNWAVSPNDLQHWLRRLREFLADGRRVEVVLGPKKRGRKATEDEARAVLETVMGTMADVRGARERAPPEGEVGAIMTLFFEGTRLKEQQQQQQQENAEEKPDEEKKEGEKEEGEDNGEEQQQQQNNKPKISRWKIKEEQRRQEAEAARIREAELRRIREQEALRVRQQEADGFFRRPAPRPPAPVGPGFRPRQGYWK